MEVEVVMEGVRAGGEESGKKGVGLGTEAHPPAKHNEEGERREKK